MKRRKKNLVVCYPKRMSTVNIVHYIKLIALISYFELIFFRYFYDAFSFSNRNFSLYTQLTSVKKKIRLRFHWKRVLCIKIQFNDLVDLFDSMISEISMDSCKFNSQLLRNNWFIKDDMSPTAKIFVTNISEMLTPKSNTHDHS